MHPASLTVLLHCAYYLSTQGPTPLRDRFLQAGPGRALRSPEGCCNRAKRGKDLGML